MAGPSQPTYFRAENTPLTYIFNVNINFKKQTTMKDLFNSINAEISLSKSKIENLKSSSIHEKAIKLDIFATEIQRLNTVLTNRLKSFFNGNDLTEQQVKKIKDFTDNAMTDFITKSGVPGINPNFKLDIDIKKV